MKKQSYQRISIEGVRLVNLQRYVDESGSFTELFRLDNLAHMLDIPEMDVAQVNYTTAVPGVIKAYHLHARQWDVWFVPPTERVLIVLRDVRPFDGVAAEFEIGRGPMERIVLGDGTSRLLVIPPGVAHGYRNLGAQPATLLYFVSEHFTVRPDLCDEYRLPWDAFGADVWEIHHG